MNNITLDGNKIQNKEQLHQELKVLLHLPEYYGMNLDALDEYLNAYNDLTVNIINSSNLVYNLEKYFFILLDIFKDHNIEVNIKVDA